MKPKRRHVLAASAIALAACLIGFAAFALFRDTRATADATLTTMTQAQTTDPEAGIERQRRYDNRPGTIP